MKTTIILTMVLTLILSGISLYAVEETKVDAKALFEKKCIQCHNLDTARTKRKTAAEWKSVVMRMKNVNRCPITDEEAEVITEYLTKNYGK